eukprot:Skav207636  [mRNA]  locus=scaffold1172:45033:47379:+ [translate_table: standard]
MRISNHQYFGPPIRERSRSRSAAKRQAPPSASAPKAEKLELLGGSCALTLLSRARSSVQLGFREVLPLLNNEHDFA